MKHDEHHICDAGEWKQSLKHLTESKMASKSVTAVT